MTKRTVEQMKQSMWEAVEEIYTEMYVSDIPPADKHSK
jgi:hypothetical protein